MMDAKTKALKIIATEFRCRGTVTCRESANNKYCPVCIAKAALSGSYTHGSKQMELKRERD